MTLDDLESKLNTLRLKWKGKVPKSSANLDWWKFKCDEAVAIGLKRKIQEIKEEKSEKVALQIFGKHEN